MKLFDSKKRLKVILALLASFTVSIIAIEISTGIATSRFKEDAYKKASLEAKHLNSMMSFLYVATDWLTNSFASGFEDNFIVSNGRLAQLSEKQIAEMMTSFLDYNYELHSCSFIFMPGVLKTAPEGIVLYCHKGTLSRLPLESYTSSQFFKDVAENKKSFIDEGRDEDGRRTWITGVPMYNEKGEIIAEFWTDLTFDFMTGYLYQYMAESDYSSMILNRDMDILCCTDTSFNGVNLLEILDMATPGDDLTEWYSDLKTRIQTGNCSPFDYSVTSGTGRTYIHKLLNTDFYLVTVKPDIRISGQISRIKRVFLLIVIISLLLLLQFLWYIFKAYKKENDGKVSLEKDLDVASRIQKSILPSLPPSGYAQAESNTELRASVFALQTQAKSVGGDLYDFFVSGNKFHFCIGDVSGKGVPAALMMAEICSLFRYISKQKKDTRSVIAEMNSSVLEHTEETMFCTFFAGILDLETGHLEFCNAGHNPPVLIPAGQDPCYLKVKANMPVCSFEGYDFKAESIDLNHGDSLLLYTDGITEAYNKEKDLFGNEAVLTSLKKSLSGNTPSFSTLSENLLKDIRSFAGGAEQNDDITLLCIGY